MSDLIHILTVAWYIVEIFLGVGFIIFVHELGHFAVAKLCGVKCEKFYLGFDIGGWKFCKFRWGETEYGIGILPLGGYVKMLGQEDNPAKLKEEIERAKLAQPSATAGDVASTAAATQAVDDGPTGEVPDDQLRTKNPSAATDFDLAQAEKALYDPRSYLAKSVPKRMAIISAGVIMNVIFGFVLAVIAYTIGVAQPICAVGEVFPGEAGWRAGLHPGDRILEAAGNRVVRFKELQKNIAVGDISNGVPMVIERPGVKEPLKVVVYPDRIREMPSIGITGSQTTKIISAELNDVPSAPFTAAAKAEPPLQFDDRITQINGRTIANYQDLEAFLAQNPEKTLHLTVDTVVPGVGGAPPTAKVVEVTIPPQPMRTLGLAMTTGEITAVQDGSPAAAAGIRAGDRLLKIDGAPIGDPMRLADALRRRSGETAVLTISRDGSPTPLEIPVKLRDAEWIEHSLVENAPVSVPALGVAVRVLNTVAEIAPDSPAEKAGIRAGTTIKSATIKEKNGDSERTLSTVEFDAAKDQNNWPAFFFALQNENPNIRVELKTANDKTFEMRLVGATDWFNPDRGFLLEPDTVMFKARTVGEALRLGAEETWDQLTLVVQILHRVGSRQVSIKAFGGPGSIFVHAYRSAKHGLPTLLLFLTMLSANLAVLNILPIPMLDGGHLMFLAYEGIRGKPANERVQIVLSVIGLFLLLALMVFVIGLDINRWILGK